MWPLNWNDFETPVLYFGGVSEFRGGKYEERGFEFGIVYFPNVAARTVFPGSLTFKSVRNSEMTASLRSTVMSFPS